MGDGGKLLTHLNSALKVLLGLDIFPRVPKKKLNFVDQCVRCGPLPSKRCRPNALNRPSLWAVFSVSFSQDLQNLSTMNRST